MRVCATFLLLICVGSVTACGSAAPSDPAPEQDDRTQTRDAYGDPLPTGAIARLGTARFRHNGILPCVAVSPDGERAATVAGDIIVWNLRTGAEEMRMRSQERALVAATFLPRGDHLAAAGDGGGLEVWRVSDGRRSAAVSAGTRTVRELAVASDGRRVLTGDEGGVLRLWDLEASREIRSWPGHNNSITCVVVHPDGRRAITAGYDGFIRIWSLDSGTEDSRIEASVPQRRMLAVDGAGGSLVWSDGMGLRVWNMEKASAARAIDTGDESIRSLHVRDGRVLTTDSRRRLRLWRLSDGTMLREVQTADVDLAQLLPDGRRVLGWDSDLSMWDLGTGQEIPIVNGHGTVHALDVSPDRRIIATGGQEGRIHTWDRFGRRLLDLAGHSGPVSFLSFAVDARRLRSAGPGEAAVLSWDLAEGKLLDRVRLAGPSSDPSPPHKVAVIGDGSEILTTTGKQACVREASTGAIRLTLNLKHHVLDAACDPRDASRIALCAGNSLLLWNIRTSDVRTVDLGEPPFAAAYHPGGAVIAVLTRDAMHWVGLASGRVIARHAIPSGRHAVLALSPDGGRMVLASEFGESRVDHKDAVLVWDIRTRRTVLRLVGHRHLVTVAKWLDRAHLASGSMDGSVLIWRAQLTAAGDDVRAGPAAHMASLADDSPGREKAQRALVSLGDAAVTALASWIEERSPVPGLATIDGACLELGAHDPEVRERAVQTLALSGPDAVPTLVRVGRDATEAEVRVRIQALLEGQDVWQAPANLAGPLGGVDVLEWIGTSRAREALRALCGSRNVSGWVREAAARSLARLVDADKF